MYTTNTINNRISKIRKAIQGLEMIGNEVNLSIINFLKKHQESNFSGLRVATDLSDIQLEKYLHFLSQNDILQTKTSFTEKIYTLNHYKLLKIQLLAKHLCQEVVEV